MEESYEKDHMFLSKKQSKSKLLDNINDKVEFIRNVYLNSNRGAILTEN